MIKKNFSCDTCDAIGQISIKNDDLTVNDIVYCPVCGAPLLDEYEEDEE
jgi:predicted  nucleic acid-binding Zn-ribbon protein